MAIASPLETGHLRPLDVRTDLASIADLIELSFSDHMDAEGRDYIRYIRRVAQNNSLIRWVPGAAELVSLPLHGYVWQEDNRIIGNLSLIPFFFQNHWIYLIANVAVHPDYRRQGIGRKLTLRAIEHIRKHEVSEAWLQVRDDNSGAYQLYRSLGFVERTRRTTWQGNSIPFRKPACRSARASPFNPGGAQIGKYRLAGCSDLPARSYLEPVVRLAPAASGAAARIHRLDQRRNFLHWTVFTRKHHRHGHLGTRPLAHRHDLVGRGPCSMKIRPSLPS